MNWIFKDETEPTYFAADILEQKKPRLKESSLQIAQDPSFQCVCEV